MKYLSAIILIFFFTELGCVSKNKSTEITSSTKSEFKKSVTDSILKRKIIEFRPNIYVEGKVQIVSSQTQGFALVDNNRTFLQALFTQSYDPYFGKPQFNEECLKKNQIGSIQKANESYSYEAHLTSESDLKIGQCRRPTEAFVANKKVIFCNSNLSVFEITVFSKTTETAFDWQFDCE